MSYLVAVIKFSVKTCLPGLFGEISQAKSFAFVRYVQYLTVKRELLKWENWLNGDGFGAPLYYVLNRKK